MNGELNYTGFGSHAWCAAVNDQNQWYQFTFKDIVPVAEVLTRGRGKDFVDTDQKVKSFKLKVSNDCSNWTWAESESKIYPANSDRDTLVTTKLPSPIMCKAIRIIPWEW